MEGFFLTFKNFCCWGGGLFSGFTEKVKQTFKLFSKEKKVANYRIHWPLSRQSRIFFYMNSLKLFLFSIEEERKKTMFVERRICLVRKEKISLIYFSCHCQGFFCIFYKENKSSKEISQCKSFGGWILVKVKNL